MAKRTVLATQDLGAVAAASAETFTIPLNGADSVELYVNYDAGGATTNIDFTFEKAITNTTPTSTDWYKVMSISVDAAGQGTRTVYTDTYTSGTDTRFTIPLDGLRANWLRVTVDVDGGDATGVSVIPVLYTEDR